MKILYVVKNMRVSNGVTSFVMNYYRELIKKNDIEIDFLVVSDVGSPFYKEIEDNGSKIYFLPPFTKVFKIFIYLNEIFRATKYDIVHSNVFNSNFPIAMVAKKYGVPVRILHSHSSFNGDSIFKIIRNKPFQFLSIYFSNYLFACSNIAGRNIYRTKPFYVVNNAIDLSKFKFDQEMRDGIRKSENVDDNKIVISTVGRITEVKNPYFILKIISELSKRNEEFVFWWFGSGNLDDVIKNKSKEMGIYDKMKFFGSVNDVEHYYSAMDVFILPSFFEGFPVVGVEAQANGLPIIFSDTITSEVKLSDSAYFLSIDSEKKWADLILKCKNNACGHSTNLNEVFINYDIVYLSNKLYNKYHELLNNMEQ